MNITVQKLSKYCSDRYLTVVALKVCRACSFKWVNCNYVAFHVMCTFTVMVVCFLPPAHNKENFHVWAHSSSTWEWL